MTQTETGKRWEWNCKMAGTRKLPGFESVRVGLASALRTISQDAWHPGRSRVKIELWASVLVLAERRDRVQQNSRTYRTSITNQAGELSELIPV